MLSSDPLRRAAQVAHTIGRGELVRVTTRLTPDAVARGAREGRFPTPRSERALVVPWFSPKQRALLRADRIHLGETLRRRLRRKGWVTSADEAFDEVVRRCAERRPTWITAEVRRVYGQLHRAQLAHSLEVWSADGDLIGGTFGVQAGGLFSADSMFHAVDHASKVAVVDLASRVREAGGIGVDCQYPTPHTLALGVQVLDRVAFERLLRTARSTPVRLPTERRPAARLIDPSSSDALEAADRSGDRAAP